MPVSSVDYMDVSPRQMVSVGASLIPFLEHDEGHRALMGTNMQRQAVPLIESERPLVGTGAEWRAAVDSGDVILAEKPGVVTYVSADIIRTMNDDGTTSSYKLAKFQRSNQTTCYNQVPLIHDGERVEAAHRAGRWSGNPEGRDGTGQEPSSPSCRGTATTTRML